MGLPDAFLELVWLSARVVPFNDVHHLLEVRCPHHLAGLLVELMVVVVAVAAIAAVAVNGCCSDG